MAYIDLVVEAVRGSLGFMVWKSGTILEGKCSELPDNLDFVEGEGCFPCRIGGDGRNWWREKVDKLPEIQAFLGIKGCIGWSKRWVIPGRFRIWVLEFEVWVVNEFDRVRETEIDKSHQCFPYLPLASYPLIKLDIIIQAPFYATYLAKDIPVAMQVSTSTDIFWILRINTLASLVLMRYFLLALRMEMAGYT